MFASIKNLIGDNFKLMRLPIFLTAIDTIGSLSMYVVLYLTVVDLMLGTFTQSKLVVYTIVCLISVIYRIVVYRQGYLLSFLRAASVTENMRVDLADHMRRLSLGYFNQNSTGYLLNTLTNDIASFEAILSHTLPFLIKTVTLGALMLIGTFFISPILALVEWAVILVALPILHWGNKLIERFGQTKRNLTDRMVSIVMEYLAGIKVFKSHNMGAGQFDRMLGALDDVRKTSIRTEQKLAVPTGLFAIIVSFLMPLTLLIGGYMLAGGGFSEVSFIGFMVISLSLTGLLTSFEHYYNMLKELKLAVSNLENAYACKPLEYIEETFELNNYDVAFENVSFRYEAGKEVLHGISFLAPNGTTTAFVGHSGSGKSTILSLITRFWDVSGGRITIGGRDIRKLNPDCLLQYIGEVFQENTLLTDTIMGNIKVGRPTATEQEVIEAAKAANCHDFIMGLPEGYQTMVAESGASLSGGERQRIAIARAILKDAPILLLDESTASLDAGNEQKINRALDELMKNKTVFVIAHRLNTIQDADKIIVMNGGQIEETGNHNKLMADNGHYARMVHEQEKACTWAVKGA